MAKLKILKDPITNESFYPYTHEKAITDDNGNEVIAAIKSDITANTTNINKNKTDIATNTSNITKNANDIKTLKSDLGNKIDKPIISDNNKLPRAKNGNVEWVEQGLPTDEQTSSAITNWLNSHPEATTTVQDNSITPQKMNESFWDDLRLAKVEYVTPEQIGIVMGDDVTTTVMQSNTEKFQNAIDNKVFVKFGNGIYCFSDSIHLTQLSHKICGSGKKNTTLKFPNSDGFLFDKDSAFYGYWTISDLSIISKYKCIGTGDKTYNVYLCAFRELVLKSEESDCIVAPPRNKGANNGDTCWWSNAFSNILGSAPNGAIFANICGLGNVWNNVNSYDETLYAYKNCTGKIKDWDSLGTIKHFLYYDNMDLHSCELHLENVNAENHYGSFIYMEDSQKNNMTIASLYCINTTFTLLNSITNHNLPPVKVSTIRRFYSWFSDIVGKNYNEQHYDKNLVPTGIVLTRSAPEVYIGDTDIIYSYNNNNTILVGMSGYITGTDYLPLAFWNKYNAPKYKALASDIFIGGKNTHYEIINTSTLSSGEYNPQLENALCDLYRFNVETTDGYTLKVLNNKEEIPGRIITIENISTSLGVLEVAYDGYWHRNVLYPTVTLAPGECAHYIKTNHKGTQIWLKIDLSMPT